MISVSDNWVENVNLVDMIRGQALPNRTVHILEGRIHAIETRGYPVNDAIVIDDSAQYLVPGLTDSHLHVDPVPGFGLTRISRNDDEQALVDQYRKQRIKRSV